MERIKIDDGSKTYEIVNQDGDVLGILRFNPSDANIMKRYDAVIDELQTYLDAASHETFTREKFVEAQDAITQKMDELLGGNAASALFSVCGALSPMANGNLYIETVLEAIGSIVEKETSKRMKKVETRMNKYLEGYKK